MKQCEPLKVPLNAPEKIYLCPSELAGIDYDEEWLDRPFGDSIEYTRTDAFIEKACEWLRENKDKYLYNTGSKGEYIPVCSGNMVDDFRKYMESE